jgi:spore maturation protein CgeB
VRIAVIGPQFADSFANNVSETLSRMGHGVVTHDGTYRRHDRKRMAAALWELSAKLIPAMDTRLSRRLLESLSETKVDLVLITHDFFSPSMVERIRTASGAKAVICWFIDAPVNLRSGNLFLCGYDAFFVKEPQLVDTMVKKLGLPAHYLPEACNPVWHKPVNPTPEQKAKYGCDVVGQGTAHAYRAKFFEGLLEHDVKIWGTPPSPTLKTQSRKMFQGHYVRGEEKAVAFACGKVFVNSIHFSEQLGVNNTLFEAAGCGVLQLCDDRPTLREFFEPDKEIVTFRSRQELKEKISYYLPRENERREIGQRASQRAHRDHSYEVRLQKMLDTLGMA